MTYPQSFFYKINPLGPDGVWRESSSNAEDEGVAKGVNLPGFVRVGCKWAVRITTIIRFAIKGDDLSCILMYLLLQRAKCP